MSNKYLFFKKLYGNYVSYFVKRELWPQSCINENVLEDNSVRRTKKGINRNPLINNEKGWFIIWCTINQIEKIGKMVEIIW